MAASATTGVQIALDLFEIAEAMTRERLRREDPDASASELERRVLAWVHERPGAEHGDCLGSLRALPG